MRLFTTLALGGLSLRAPTLYVGRSVCRSRRTALRCLPPRACADGGPQKSVLSLNEALDFSLPFRVLAFYAIAPIADPEVAVAAHRQFLADRKMVGRVYLCAEGLNAQVSGATAACEEYREFASAAFPSTSLVFKEDPIGELAFPKLRVKHKGLVPAPASGAAVDLADRGEDLGPEAWAAMLAEASAEAVVLDVRNGYEWDVGRFDRAARPALDDFAEFEPSTYGLPTDAQGKRETPVMMYCTGGIRCEYFSARLKAEGFEKVYKLHGGIQHYGNHMANKPLEQSHAAGGADGDGTALAAADAVSGAEGDAASDGAAADDPASNGAASDGAASDGAAADDAVTPHWRGSLFVFDRRNTLRFGAEAADGASAAEPIGACMHCSASTEAFFNCANIDCNMLHLVCPKCLSKHRGFCSEACKTAPRRRPLDLLASTEDGEIDFRAAIAATQGPPPGQSDPNKLSSFKPDNLPRKEFDADRHLAADEQPTRA